MPDYIEQGLYKAILENMPLACVDVAIASEGKILLVLRKDKPAQGQWWVPGGRVWKGEKMKETALRKALDEVGLDCHVGPLIYTAETIFPDGPNGVPVHSINSCFLLYPKNNTIATHLDEHHETCKWVKEIPRGLHPYVQKCLLAAGLEYEKDAPHAIHSPTPSQRDIDLFNLHPY